jgi:RluA family pseudouridine synthase
VSADPTTHDASTPLGLATSARVVAEEPGFLVIDKPAGIATIPERDLGAPSVVRALEAALGERLFVVHRLDKEVSGLIVFARDAATHRALSMAFEHREVEKTYLAVLHGALPWDERLVDAPIAAFGSGRMGVRARDGKPSQTRFRVRRKDPATTLVEADPTTGRRHQIRVHAYHLGHPIVGDLRYGDRTVQSRYERLFLHAWRLTLPVEGERRTFESDVPGVFGAAPTVAR